MFNIFDAIVVAFSLVELVFELAPNLKGFQGLTVLRTFRLLRVFKLVRTWVALRNLLNTILLSLYVEKSRRTRREQKRARERETREMLEGRERMCARVCREKKRACVFV